MNQQDKLEKIRKPFHTVKNKLNILTMRGEFYPVEPSYRDTKDLNKDELNTKYQKLLDEIAVMGKNAELCNEAFKELRNNVYQALEVDVNQPLE